MAATEQPGAINLDAGTSHTDVGQRGVGELVKEVTQDLSKLFSQELTLAKAEMKIEAKKAGKTAGAFGGAGLAGWFTLLFLSVWLMYVLTDLFDSIKWGAFVVTLLWGIGAAVLFMKARTTAKSIDPKPEVTVQTLKEDAQWAKTRKS